MTSHRWEEWDSQTRERMAEELLIHGAARARLVVRGLGRMENSTDN